MKQHNEKFEAYIQGRISKREGQRVTDRHGVIMSYDPFKNTATVALSGQDSDNISDLTKNVPCPTYNGIQLAAPEPGRGCWVIFKGGRESQPVITHFFNYDYESYDYGKQSSSVNDLPRYLMM